ncbi:MAG: peptidoglycan-associated lipoprotein Pal [Chlorobiaceae bacterium]|nr:peptidoglycan-associated lipoprotein Pal [Chlorobiaceae bacterium]
MRIKVNGIVVIALMMTAGCSSNSAVKSTESSVSQEQPVTSVTPVVSLPESPTGYGFDKWQTGPLGDLFFDFDSSVLSSDAQEQLKQNAAWFGSNPARRALIEGHCDSRGTSEYNLALGERRSDSAKEYLVKLGVKLSRLETLSFGQERPFALGENEEAWAKNRRAHFVVKP